MKVFFSILAFLLTLLVPGTAMSANFAKLTNVAVKRSASGVTVDILFDRPIASKALKPVFERNFVQLVLKGTKMDSAQMIPVSESEVTKVFAYPYSADIARVRIILKRDNQWAKGKVSISNNSPKSVRLFIKEGINSEQTGLSGIKKRTAEVQQELVAKNESAERADEKALIGEVVSKTRDIDIHNPDSVKAALGAEKTPAVESQTVGIPGKTEQVGVKTDPTKHFTRMAIALFGVLAVFIGGALLVRRYASKLKRLPFGKKERLIQVVATHYLGNKKSISLVKVTGEYMVVGTSNEGISLISKLGAEVNVDKYLEDRFWGGTFEKHLDSYAKDAKTTKEIDLSANPALANYDGVRDLAAPTTKPEPVINAGVRASIKEKLTKLKPLA